MWSRFGKAASPLSSPFNPFTTRPKDSSDTKAFQTPRLDYIEWETVVTTRPIPNGNGSKNWPPIVATTTNTRSRPCAKKKNQRTGTQYKSRRLRGRSKNSQTQRDQIAGFLAIYELNAGKLCVLMEAATAGMERSVSRGRPP
jgi:hypothetical protein